MWNTEEGWRIVDDALQIRGGRGYETADSLRARGEAPIPVERMMRDFAHQPDLRGLVARSCGCSSPARRSTRTSRSRAPSSIRRRRSDAKLAALPKMARLLRLVVSRALARLGALAAVRRVRPLAGHVRFVERTTRKLGALALPRDGALGPKLEKRQALLFRAVDIGAELFAMAAALSRADALRRAGAAEAATAAELTDVFCRGTRRRIADHFRGIGSNDDVAKYRTARRLLDGEFAWLEQGLTAMEPEPGLAEPSRAVSR